MGEKAFLKVTENKGLEKIGPKLDGKPQREQSSALDDCQQADNVSFRNEERVAMEGGSRAGKGRVGGAEVSKCLSECLTNSRSRSHRNCI